MDPKDLVCEAGFVISEVVVPIFGDAGSQSFKCREAMAYCVLRVGQ